MVSKACTERIRGHAVLELCGLYGDETEKANEERVLQKGSETLLSVCSTSRQSFG